MEKPTSSLRFRVLRGALIVVIAANASLAMKVLPLLAPAEFTRTRSISELARVRNDFFSQRRVVCIVLYERYDASTLYMTPEAFDYLSLEKQLIARYARVSSLHIVPAEEIPGPDSYDRTVVQTVELEPPEGPATFHFLAGLNDSGADDVYAVLSTDGLVFYPGGN